MQRTHHWLAASLACALSLINKQKIIYTPELAIYAHSLIKLRPFALFRRIKGGKFCEITMNKGCP